jgi:hypothetical protein
VTAGFRTSAPARRRVWFTAEDVLKIGEVLPDLMSPRRVSCEAGAPDAQEPSVWGPAFELLRDPAVFAEVMVDRDAGAVVWPNGADISPEELRLKSRPTVGGQEDETR